MGCGRSEPVPVKSAAMQVRPSTSPETSMIASVDTSSADMPMPMPMPMPMVPHGLPSGDERRVEAPFIADPTNARWSDVIRGDLRVLTSDKPCAVLPMKMWPVLCLSDLSLPIIVMPVILLSGEGTDLQLPVMAISRHKLGRIIALGSFEILTQCSKEREPDTIFVENILKFAGGTDPGARTGLIYAVDASVSELLCDVMSGFGFAFEIQESGEIDYQRFIVVILASDCTETKGLDVFLSQGGCVICAPGDEESKDCFSLNSVIGQGGVAFSQGPVYFSRSQETFYRFDRVLKDLYSYGLPSVARRFQDAIQDKEIQEEALDTLVATLRYHVNVVVGRRQLSGLRGMCAEGIRYLYDTSYIQNKLLCSEYKHAVVSILLSETFPTMLPRDLSFDLSATFPGKCEVLQGQDIETISVTIGTGEWASTELYLRAGVAATVKVRTVIRGLILQIGAHTESLSGIPGPWKRWPAVTLSYTLQKGLNDIVSPFGGLLYFRAPGVVKQRSGGGAQVIEAMFSGVLRAPIYHHSKPGKWIRARTLEIPFAELIGRRVIITVPTADVRKLTHVQPTVTFVDEIIDLLTSLLGIVKESAVFRVVFDVQLPNDRPVVGYPLILDYSWIDTIFERQEMNHKLFNFIALLALAMLPPGLLTASMAAGVAMTAAWCAARRKWPKTDVALFCNVDKNDVPGLMIRGIYESGNSALANALKYINETKSDSPDDSTTVNGEKFCKAFCQVLSDEIIAKASKADAVAQ